MLSQLAQLVMFISSFGPLLAVFGVLHSLGKGLPSLICYAVALASIVGLNVVLRVVRGQATATMHVARSRARDSDAIAYVVTYLVPFVTFPSDTWQARVAILIFFATIAVLYLRAFLFYVNPLLSAVGYRLFEIESTTGRVRVLITKRRTLEPDQEVRTHSLSDYVLLEAR